MAEPVFVNNIFADNILFEDKALQLFQFQYANNNVYRQWCSMLNVDPLKINCLTEIPYLPVSFFKSHEVVTGSFRPEVVFTSSGTTQTINSRHLVKDAALYTQSFVKAFELFYGDVKHWCVLGLLPSYLERNGSSLVVMVDELIKLSGHPSSGFYLYDEAGLAKTLQQLEEARQPTILIGVTYALLDFAEKYHMHLKHTVIMETGGMKGRRREMTRQEVHSALTKGLGVDKIHSEYGMTELLSQAYSKGDSIFVCPPWMKVLVRDEEDPLYIKENGRGVLNIIDLANIYSCGFIAVDDVGVMYEAPTETP
jgi:phenylacetate-coenzyme A ligase PaaK-like adenylate-forming protein